MGRQTGHPGKPSYRLIAAEPCKSRKLGQRVILFRGLLDSRLHHAESARWNTRRPLNDIKQAPEKGQQTFLESGFTFGMRRCNPGIGEHPGNAWIIHDGCVQFPDRAAAFLKIRNQGPDQML